MKTQTRKIFTGLAGLVLSASAAVADIGGGGGGYRRPVEDTQELVKHIQNPEIMENVVTQLYLQNSIDSDDPILPEVVGLLEKRKHYVDASILAEKLGNDAEAVRLYSRHVDSRLSNTEETNALELYSLGRNAKRQGLDEQAKDVFNRVIELLETTREYERAGDVASEDLGDHERADKFYKIALKRALETEDPLDDAQLHGKLRQFEEADGIYSRELKRAEERCDFYKVHSLYAKRAEMAERKGDSEAKENLEKASNAFYSLYRLGVHCRE